MEYFNEEWRRYCSIYNKLLNELKLKPLNNKFLDLFNQALKDGFPVDFRPNNHYSTLIQETFYARRPDITKALLEAGADVNICDGYKRTILVLAIMWRYEPRMIIEIARKSTDLDVIDDISGMTAFGILCEKFILGNNDDLLPCIKELLELGADTTIGEDFRQRADMNVHGSRINKLNIRLRILVTSPLRGCYAKS